MAPRSEFVGGVLQVNAADHGFDPPYAGMHGIFYSADPGIAPGQAMGAFAQGLYLAQIAASDRTAIERGPEDQLGRNRSADESL